MLKQYKTQWWVKGNVRAGNSKFTCLGRVAVFCRLEDRSEQQDPCCKRVIWSRELKDAILDLQIDLKGLS